MLKTIRLRNFKLHEDTQIDAAPITVFIGPNNSGKSSIFQALLLLRQAAARNDHFLCQPPAGIQPAPTRPYMYSPNILVDAGTFKDIVRKSESQIQVRVVGADRPPTLAGDFNEAIVDFEVGVKDNRLALHKGSIKCSGSETRWELVGGRLVSIGEGLRIGDVVYRIEPQNTFNLTRLAGFSITNPAPAPEAISLHNDSAQWFGSVPSRLLHSLHPVYALRGFEEWGYEITDSPPSLALLTLHDRALALPNALASDRKLKERLSERLEEILQVTIDFEVITGKRLKIWAKPMGTGRAETLFANEGTGANQLPFILVPLLLTPPDETILLSEPEAHLHPKAQCELTRMLLRIAKRENLQFFFETHSEHVLHVILNAIGKREWDRSDVAIYSFENVNGTARVNRLEIDEQGGVKGGLPGFFDQSLDELSEYLETVKKPTA